MPDRILLVSPASPFNPQSGAQQRTALLHEALQTLGEVDVLLIEPTADSSRLESPGPGILAHGRWHQHPLGIGKFKPDYVLSQALRASGVDLGRYRLVVSRYLNPLAKLVLPPGVRSVVDLDDWDYHYSPGALALAAQFKRSMRPGWQNGSSSALTPISSSAGATRRSMADSTRRFCPISHTARLPGRFLRRTRPPCCSSARSGMHPIAKASSAF